MRTLVLVHRWLGVALCLLFAMWFTSGIALHFVPYPKFDTAERLAAEAPLAVSSGCCVSMTVAMNAAGVEAAAGRRVRLAMLDARPVYPLATWSSRAKWSVHHQWNPWRPFHRVALGDEAGTVLYVSAQTGEVVRDTNRTERIVGWIGAGPHWLYPTVLRRLPAARRQTVIWISAAGVIGALTGWLPGVLRLHRRGCGFASPFYRWHRWHYSVGLAVAVFLTTWILRGFLWVNPVWALVHRGGTDTRAGRGLCRRQLRSGDVPSATRRAAAIAAAGGCTQDRIRPDRGGLVLPRAWRGVAPAPCRCCAGHGDCHGRAGDSRHGAAAAQGRGDLDSARRQPGCLLLAACRTWVFDSETVGQRGQILSISTRIPGVRKEKSARSGPSSRGCSRIIASPTGC